MNICIACNWEKHLSDRYEPGPQPKLRDEVRAWQEDLATEIRSSIVHLNLHLGPQVVVDIEVFFPDDGEARDAVDYLKGIMDAIEMATGIRDTNFVPFIRSVQSVRETEAGFLVRLYSAHFGGINLTGTINHFIGSGQTVIKLDKALPAEWDGTDVVLNLGVIHATGDD